MYFFAALVLVYVDVMVMSSALVLFNVCSAVTVECCVLYPYCVGIFALM